MKYYKKNSTYYASPFPPKNMEGVIEISEEEYEAYLKSLELPEPDPEEVKALEREAKEEQLAQLMQELYPEYATQMLGALQEGAAANEDTE